MPGPIRDPRADALRARYAERFSAPELPVPVEAIAEDLLGLNVAEDDDLWCSGLLLPAGREIWLNGREARESPGRRRFTLAHELGHWICQCLEGRAAPMYCRSEEVGVRKRADPLEREANVFAAELLMPAPLLRNRAATSGRVGEIACDFGVSEEAMHWRLYNLRLVEESPVA